MTKNNLSDALYSERVEKILNTSVELIDEKMALELEKEWKKVKDSLLEFPELVFGNDKDINDIPFNNQILTIKSPKGYIYIKLFIEDNKKTWDLKIVSRHPSGALAAIRPKRKIVIEDKWIENPHDISYELLRGGMYHKIRENFYTHYRLFYKIIEYRSILFEKYTNPLMKFFDVDEFYASKKNRSFFARKEKVMVLEGIVDNISTGVDLYIIHSNTDDYKEREYKGVNVSRNDNEYPTTAVIQRQRLYKFTKEELAAHFTLVRNLKNEDTKNNANNIVLPLLSIMKGYEEEDKKSIIDNHMTKRLDELINRIFSDCKFPSEPSKVGEYLDNVNDLRKSIKNTLIYVCNSLRGITIDCDRENESYVEVLLNLNPEFSQRDTEKNYLSIHVYDEKEGKKSIEIMDEKLDTLVNYAHSLFFLYNNITLDMICYMSDKNTINVKKANSILISESILRQKIDNMMKRKTNLSEILNESTVGHY